MRHSLESLGHSRNLDVSRDPEGINRNNKQKDPWDMSGQKFALDKLKEAIANLPEEDSHLIDSQKENILNQMGEIGKFGKPAGKTKAEEVAAAHEEVMKAYKKHDNTPRSDQSLSEISSSF